jgi:hypothetical protein
MIKTGVGRWALGVGMMVLLTWPGYGFAPSRRAPPASVPALTTLSPDQMIQIKLRDLLGLVPAKSEDLTELIARLKGIEGQLIRIEQILAAIAANVGTKVQTNPYPEPLAPAVPPPPDKKR